MKKFDRAKKIEEIKAKFTLPRVQLSILIGLTGSFGFLCSTLLLWSGVSSMAVRYTVSIGVSYVGFLLLLKLWLWMQAGTSPEVDDIFLDGDLPTSSINASDINFEGGGDFAGAGVGGEWSEPVNLSSGTSSSGGGSLDIGLDLDLDDWGFLIVAVIAILAAIFAIFYIVYIAPVLLAEIFLDGVLVSGLYRSMKNVERRYWLTTALKKTAIPAILIALFIGAAGYFLQKAVPEAESIGDIWKSLNG